MAESDGTADGKVRKRKARAAEDAAPPPEAGSAADAGDDGSGKVTLSKRVFLESVVAASGVKKKVVRAVVEATLAEIGAALERGETLVLPPMGRMVVSRAGTGKGASVVRFRRVTGGKGKGGGDEALAEADEAE